MSFSYPVMLDLSGRLAVVVGGGRVAQRKIQGLLGAGCGRVRVVAKAFAAEFPQEIEKVAGGYAPAHLDGAFLAFAATDSSDVNDAVVRDATARGILVTRADADEELAGTFANAATHRDYSLVIAVSAGGAPALAARVRDELVRGLNPAFATMAETMQRLRPRVKESGLPIAERSGVFRDLASEEAIQMLSASGQDELWRWLVERHPALKPRE